MAKKKTSLPYLPTQQDAIKAVIKLLDESRAPTFMHSFEHFSRALDVWESALRQDPMGPWLEACQGLEFAIGPLGQALAILIDQAQANYYDIIGGVYMALGEGDRRFGQYFTPWGVARMMAEICLSDFKPPGPGEPPIKFCEPCVGSGVFILAAAEVVEERFPGTIARGEIEFYGQDKDPCCVKMCRVNMKIHGIGRLVQRIEDLSPQQRRTLERLLGRRLPESGTLVDDPEIRTGDTLLDGALVSPAAEAPAPDRQPQQQGEPAEAPPAVAQEARWAADHELIVVPELVARDLWAAVEPTTAQETGQAGGKPARPPSRRRKGERAALPPQEYSSVPLFSPDEPAG